MLNARPHEAPVDHPLPEAPSLVAREQQIEVRFSADIPPLRLQLLDTAGAFTVDPLTVQHLHYRLEQSRGYQASGDAWSPGYFRVDLAEGQSVTVVASTESVETMTALTPNDARSAELERRRRLLLSADPVLADHATAELVLAADQFVVTPAGRVEDAARARAAGDEARTVIAGYHWFTDWGRDTMISLEGLTLTTGRVSEARDILRTFAYYFRDGLIPNLFPEGNKEGLYNTADATMWFFHALDRYLDVSGDWATIQLAAPQARCRRSPITLPGTRFNIGVDPADGLLRQGIEGLALTWMDAKMGDWILDAAPRQGRRDQRALVQRAAAARRLARARGRRGRATCARSPRALANRSTSGSGSRKAATSTTSLTVSRATIRRAGPIRSSPSRCAIRCSIESRWGDVLEVVETRLLTPMGLRSLDPGHPAFKAKYDGDLQMRDGAYHQGTVWAWLIGPFIDAWVHAHPDDAGGRPALPGRIHPASRRGVRRAASARSSTPSRRTPRAAASRRRGAWPKSCAAG